MSTAERKAGTNAAPAGGDEATGERHDAFISYSHQDREFVVRLRAALERQGKRAWLDESGIRPAERWDRALKRAIDGADVLVFVISPGSAASRECGEELEHGVERGKRIVPVVWRAVAPERLPEALAALQFVPPRGEFDADFGASLERLITAIETDLDWLQEHTRWGLKAIEWAEHERDPSFLLSGSELNAAELWLAGQAGKQPAPTALHTEFILLSRRNAVRRMRRTGVLVSAALVVVSALAVVALILRGQAVANQQIAQSRQLASEGAAALSSDPELSTLLSVHALAVQPTAQAESALRRAAPTIQLLETFPGTTALRRAAFSPDGRQVITAGQTGTAVIWNVATGRRLETLAEPAAGGFGSRNVSILGNTLTAASFSPDGSSVLTASSDTTARVWNAASGRQESVLLSARPNTLNDAAFNRAGTRVVTASEDGTVIVWRPDSPRGRALVTLHEPGDKPVQTAVFSPDGAEVLTASDDGTARVWSLGSGHARLVLREPRGEALTAASFSASGREIVTASADGTARVWDAATGAPVVTFGARSGSSLQTATFSPDGSEVVTAGNGQTATVWDVATGEQLTVLQEPQGPRLSAASFSPDGSRVLTASLDGTARIWDAAPRQLLQDLLEPGGAAVDGVAFSPTGAAVASASADGTTRVFATASGQPLAVMHEGRDGANFRYLGNGVNSVIFSADGRELVTSSNDGTARIWDAASGAQLRRLDTGFPTFSAQFIDHGARVLATTGGAGLSVFDVRTGRSLATCFAPGQELLYGAAVSPSGRELVSAGRDGSARVLAVPTPSCGTGTSTERQRLVLHEPQGSPVGTAVFSPDGGRILTASDDGTARVWDARTGRLLLVVHDPAGSRFYAAVFRPDGRELVTVDGAGTATIWDARTGKQLTSLGYAQGGRLDGVAFGPDASELITAGYDGRASVWSTALAAPLASVRRVALARVERALPKRQLGDYLQEIRRS